MKNIASTVGDPPQVMANASEGSLKQSFHHGDLRRALIDSALESEDIEGLSLRQLAAQLGVTAPAVYRHFESREALLTELARIGFERLEARFAQATQGYGDASGRIAACARLIRLGHAYLSFADEESALWRLMFGKHAVQYRAYANPAGRPLAYVYLPDALHGLQASGVIAYMPDESDVLFAWSAVHGMATLRQGGVPAACHRDLSELAHELAKRIVRGLGGELFIEA